MFLDECCAFLSEEFKKINYKFILKSSYYKANRTSYSSFRGPGIDKGLKILNDVKEKYSLTITSDIHGAQVMQKRASSGKGCVPFRQKLSAFADGEVSADWREKIEAHLAICPDCRQALSELRSLWQALEDPISAQTRQGFTQDVVRKINGGTQSHRHAGQPGRTSA